MSWWLLKNLILNLSPARRLFLVVSLWMSIQAAYTFSMGSGRVNVDLRALGFLLLLLVLMLELKDKLMARNELEVGRKVQIALLPDCNPTLSGWDLSLFTRPANEVGGDMVDYLRIDESRLGVALGDVSGKGLGAALLMAKLQATLWALATDFSSLAELGARANGILCRDGLPGSFATLVYLELGPDSGQVRVLNAGHLPPITVQSGRLETLPPVATPLGALPGSVYTEQRVEIEPGGFLLVYSDGLTEARNKEGEFFGEERLRALLPGIRGLSAGDVGSRLLAEVERFVGEERYSDDLSLAILRRLE
jgi:sigma-B regulation protein RsbU (phosphoserine phosphatase)